MTRYYRPTGPLRWMIGKFSEIAAWDVIGTIAAEDRSTAVLGEINNLQKLGEARLVQVIDEDSEFLKQCLEASQNNRENVQAMLGEEFGVFEMDLMAEFDELNELMASLSNGISPNVILDITSFPKRFFFFAEC